MTDNQALVDLNSRVKTVWRRSQNLHVNAGLLAFFRWVVLLFAVGVLLDWLIDLPSPFRMALLAVIVLVSLYHAWRSGWRNIRRFSASRAALQMEDHQSGLESLLVTAIQFRESKVAPGTSKALQEVTCRRAEEAVASVQPEKVVHYRGLRGPLTIALALVLLIAAFGVFNGPFLAAGVARIFPPWLAIAYPKRTQLEVAPDKIIVKEGSPAVIEASVKGVIPRQAKLALRTGKGDPRIHKLEIIDGRCEYTIKAAYRGFEYRITAGDAKSPWQEVEVISSPRIKQANVTLEYPAYTERPAETVEALTVTVPEGTDIEWKLSLDRAVSKATYTPAGGEAKPLDVSEDGFSVSMRAPATESRAYSFSWVEKEHGFAFASSNHYLQVAPDEAPRVELTSPGNNLYATLGRKVDLAFRGRDDHGIGDTHIAYRVNKIEEQKVAIPAPQSKEGAEQKIDWDYRSALPDLAIGDTVSFVVELADHYPGDDGPHQARSQARSITFLSEKDYLAQINKQKQRLLLKLRTLYREERKVHATVSKLDPSAGEFIQSCQLEAVRQDLMRDRIGALKQGIQDLMDDIAANNITDESVTAILVSLHADLQRIADDHVGVAATKLRELGSAARKKSESGPPSPAVAINSVDGAARELGCLVLQIGFREATEVMARELHAIAETQAPMRLQTILLSESAESEAAPLAKSQEQLGQWVTRLFGSLPRDKESTVEDALVAFNLSRLVKGLRQAGVETKMQEATALIRKPEAAETNEAASLQSEVIEALLYAEFRLRIGAEREALDKAGDLFAAQVAGQQKLREAIAALTPDQFKQGRDKFVQSQADLQKQLHLLLMPAIPAPRPALFDTDLPSQPPVEELLAGAERAMKVAAAHIDAGERDQAVAAQQEAEQSFNTLAGIIRQRLDNITERAQFASLSLGITKHASEIAEFEERQLILIEKTEDSEDDKEAVHIGRLQEKLAQDIGKFRLRVDKWNEDQLKPGDDVLPLLNYLEQLEESMHQAATALTGKNIDDAIEHQEDGLIILEDATKLLDGQSLQVGSLAMTLNDTWTVMLPAPYVADIQAEQLDLVKETAKAKPDELPHLAIVQKNLIHAVNAVLGALDPLSHQIESGTVFLFAKDDMDAAAVAIEDNDMEEAADAGSFVAESLQDLSDELAVVTPRYSYILEICEFYQEAVTENGVIRMQQNQLRTKAGAADDAAALSALVDAQTALQTRAKSYADRMLRGAGQKIYGSSAESMAAVLNELKTGNRDAAVAQMELAETALTDEGGQMVLLMELLANVLKPSPTPEVTPESAMVLDILSVASDQKVLYRNTQAAQAKPGRDLAAKQLKLATRCQALIQRTGTFAQTHVAATLSGLEPEALIATRNSLQQLFTNNQAHIVQAHQLTADAAGKLQSGNARDAIVSQHQAGERLRYVLVAYIDALLSPPGPPAHQIPSSPIPPNLPWWTA